LECSPSLANDGYALTAAHVLREGEKSCILTSPSDTKRIHVCQLQLQFKDGSTVNLKRYVQAYPWKKLGLEGIPRKAIRPGNIRLVHRFPGRDLALVKIPQKGKNFFKFGKRPAAGAVLFSSGNSQASQPGASSGFVKKITKRNLMITSMPLAPGDSGGPAMDASGGLVGIVVQGRPGKLNTVRVLNYSGIELIPQKEVAELIRRDRAQSIKN
jgi:hypothetical protein